MVDASPPNLPKLQFSQQIPNALTAGRIVLAALVWLDVPFHGTDEVARWWLRGIFAAAALSDGLDGLIARKLGCVSRFGYFLDSVADKLFFNTFLLLLAFSEESPFPVELPTWLALAVLIKDVSSLTGGVIIRLLTGEVEIRPSLLGKLATFSVVVLVGIVLATPDLLDGELAQRTVWRGAMVVAALAGLALIGYAYEVVRLYPQPEEKASNDAR